MKNHIKAKLGDRFLSKLQTSFTKNLALLTEYRDFYLLAQAKNIKCMVC
ncbi:MAG: hypothetical protein ACHBN1_25025 [Heteroscytonema crispum UTEX LB 1556]